MLVFSDQLIEATKQLSNNDPILRSIIATTGVCSIEPHTNYYQELVDSIISQQLSIKAARTIERRFCELFGSTDFPPPEKILEKSVEELRTAGLSGAKAAYVRDLAQHVLDGKLKFDQFNKLSNQEIIDELMAVKGIGEWTAHMFLIFSLGRLDVLPVGDLGIRSGIQKLYGFDHLPSPIEIEQVATSNGWHPYESVASWYVWHSLDNVSNNKSN